MSFNARKPKKIGRKHRYNTDGTLKLNPVVPHHQSSMTGEMALEHWSHIPEGDRTDEHLHFERWHFKDESEAHRFNDALTDDSGFGQVIERSVRACSYWQPKVLALLPFFETGPINLAGGDCEYSDPATHAKRKVFSGFEEGGIDLEEVQELEVGGRFEPGNPRVKG